MPPQASHMYPSEAQHPACSRAASTPTSSLKSSSLTDSDRTITGGELSSSAASDAPATNETGQQKQQQQLTSTTTKILNEFVRYEERPDQTEETNNNNNNKHNNELRATNDADANELGGKCGQGDHRAGETTGTTTTTIFEPRNHRHHAVVAVEH